jgi:tetratricopeptide (TPR) repeat protein
VSRKTDEYGFPIPEGFDDEPKPAARAPRIAPLVVLPLLMMVATGVASAIKFWPQWVDHAGRFAQAFDRRAGALELAERRIRRNPNDLHAYLMRGDAHLRHGNYAQAVRDYDHVVQRFPGDAALERRLAIALNNYAYERAQTGEDLDAALEDVQRATERCRPRHARLPLLPARPLRRSAAGS